MKSRRFSASSVLLALVEEEGIVGVGAAVSIKKAKEGEEGVEKEEEKSIGEPRRGGG